MEHVVALRYEYSLRKWSIWVDGIKENEGVLEISDPLEAHFKVGEAVASIQAQAFNDLSCHQYSTDHELFETMLRGSVANRKCYPYIHAKKCVGADKHLQTHSGKTLELCQEYCDVNTAC